MEDSILTSIKKLLGIAEECEDFDVDVTIFINTTFPILSQLGIRSDEGFFIEESKTTWKDYITSGNTKLIGMVKTFIYLKVRLLFDPPVNSTLLQSIEKSIEELEDRIIYEVENNENL